MAPAKRPDAPVPGPGSVPLAPVLVVTEDTSLVAEVQRCAAGTGVGVDVRGWGPDVLHRWGHAPVVLLGDDAAAAVAAAGVRRRGEVHLLCRGLPGPDDYRAAVAVGAESVTALDGARDRLRDLLQERAAPSAAGRVVAMLPGSGGAGASTTLAAVALTAARRGARVLVLDCDPVGAGVARILGADALSGLGWRDVVASPGRVGPVSLAEAVPRVDGVGVLGDCPGLLAPGVVNEVAETARHVHDLVLVDLPRTGVGVSGDDGVDGFAGVVARADRTLLVVRPGLVGVAAARRLVESWGGPLPTAGLVLRGRGAAPARVSAALGLPVVSRLPEHRGVAEAVDLGLGPVPRRRGPWARAVEALLDTVLDGVSDGVAAPAAIGAALVGGRR